MTCRFLYLEFARDATWYLSRRSIKHDDISYRIDQVKKSLESLLCVITHLCESVERVSSL